MDSTSSLGKENSPNRDSEGQGLFGSAVTAVVNAAGRMAQGLISSQEPYDKDHQADFKDEGDNHVRYRETIEQRDENIVKLTDEREDLMKIIANRDKKIARQEQVALEQELQISQQLSASGSSGDNSGVRKLRENAREQSQKIIGLKKRIKQLEGTLQLADTDKTSYEYMVQDAEDERDKVKEDFENAREEIQDLKRRNEDLQHELYTSKQDMQKQNHELGVTAMGDIAAAKAEAEIYKADFNEERRDREKARGELDALRKEKGGQVTVYHEEIARLNKEIDALKKERHQLITGHARSEAKLQEKEKHSQDVINQLRREVEGAKTSKQTTAYLNERMLKIAKERDELKQEVERRRKTKPKPNELDKLEKQFRHATNMTLDLTEQVDNLKKELQKSQKKVKKAEDRVKKLDKPKKGAQSEPLSESRQTEVEQCYEVEQNQNEKLQCEILELKNEVDGHRTLVASLKQLIRKENPPSPGDSKRTLASPTTGGPLQIDPNYVVSEPQPELGLKDQLHKQFAAAKHMDPHSSPQGPMEAGAGNFSQSQSKTESFGRNQRQQVPSNQVMARGSDPAGNSRGAGEWRGKQENYNQYGAQGRRQSGDATHQLTKHPQRLGLAQHDKVNQQNRHYVPSPTADDIPPLQPQQNLQQGASYLLPAQSESHVLLHGDLHGVKGSPSQCPGGRSEPMDPRGHPPQDPGRRSEPIDPRGHPRQPPDIRRQYSNENSAVVGSHGMSAPHMPYSNETPSEDRRGRSNQPQPYRAGGKSNPMSASGVGVTSQNNLSRQQPNESERYHDNLGLPDHKPGAHPHTYPQGGPTHSVDTQTSQEYESFTPTPSADLATQTSVPAGGSVSTQTSTEAPATTATAAATAKKATAKKYGELDLSQTENTLVKSIDTQIQDMAAEVREEVSEENRYKETRVFMPFDPNLVCPVCGKRHRIGEIQKFRMHVNRCDGEEGTEI